MKFLKFYVVALFVTLSIFSCKKDHDNDTPSTNNTLAGKWVGTYGYNNDVPTIYYSFDIRSNGEIDELNTSGNSKGGGTWSLNGNTFTAHYQWKAPLNTVFSVAATYNASTGKLSGTWGYNNNTTGGGKWEMTK